MDHVYRYVASPESVKSSRAQWATETGAPTKAVKTLCSMIGYGNSGADWMQENQVSALPTDIKGMKTTLNTLAKVSWRDATEERKNACSAREHPELTNMSLNAQCGEREMVEAKAAQLTHADSRVCGYIFDSVVSTGAADPGPLDGVDTQRSSLVMSVDEYKAFICERHGISEWEPLDPAVLNARQKGSQFATWLYDKSRDEIRPGRPLMKAAEAVSPFCEYNVNRDTGAIEYFDATIGVWKRSGGESFISGKALSQLLQTHVYSFAMSAKATLKPGKMMMQQLEPHLGFEDPAWLTPIFSVLKSLPGPYANVPLDSLPASKKQIVCANGVTVDFNLPYKDQVRMSVPEDRNSRHTSYQFTPIDSAPLRSAAGNLACLLVDMDPATTAEDLVNSVGDEFIALMQDGHAPMFKHMYYETAGGSLESEDPKDNLYEGIYALRQDITT